VEDKQKLLDICDAAIQFFADNGKNGERFKYTIDRVGRDVFAKKIQDVYNG
jgi:dissimilatory sulfite reductase (desulfoviridin) alpha/beta subunit